jgi:hypothetical protein
MAIIMTGNAFFAMFATRLLGIPHSLYFIPPKKDVEV